MFPNKFMYYRFLFFIFSHKKNITRSPHFLGRRGNSPSINNNPNIIWGSLLSSYFFSQMFVIPAQAGI